MSEGIWPLALEKYSGAGNDFLLIDVRETGPPGDPPRLARALCRRGHSVGADGMIFLEAAEAAAGSPEPVIRMRLWNADGSPAEISGNGARCVARWAVDQGMVDVGEEVVLATDVGPLRAWVDRDTTRLSMPAAARAWPGCRLRVEGRDLTGTYVEVGVPFFVCFHERPEDLAVRFLGRAIRGHEVLRPRGANVDFVRVEGEQRLSFRVYERGVEDETLSSGTGSIAAALAAAAAGRVASPVECAAPGATLTVRFRRRQATRGEGMDREAGDEPGGNREPGSPEDEGESGGKAQGADERGGNGTGGGDPAGSGENAGAGDDERQASHPSSHGPGIAFEAIEVEGDARRVLRGEAFAGATRG